MLNRLVVGMACVFLQLLPAICVYPVELYSQSEVLTKIGVCYDEYVAKLSREYEEVKSTGRTVYVSLDDYVLSSGKFYKKLCSDIVARSVSRYDLNASILVFFVYVLPVSILSANSEKYSKCWCASLTRNRFVKRSVFFLVIGLGCVLVWDFALSGVAHEKIFGQILFG